MNEDKIINELDPKAVRPDDIVAFHFYTKVVKIETGPQGQTQLVVKDLENDQLFTVQGEPIIQRGFSGNYVKEEVKMSRTKIIGVLKDSPNKPIQIQFTKKDGSARNMICRFLGTSDTGYAQVEELVETGPQLRQVDLRTMEWMVVEGTKYVVK